MSVTSFIARRYMQTGQKNSFFSWISVLTIAGVAIGVAAMIVVWSVINGFETELRSRFLSANAHIMAYRAPSGIRDPETWAATIRRDFPGKLSGIAPFVHYETMVRKDGLLHGVMVRGTDPKLRESVQSLAIITRPPEALQILQKEISDAAAGKGLPAVPAAVVGSGLMTILGVKVGDTFEMVESGDDQTKHDSSVGKMRSLKIVGIYDSGLKHYDNKLVLMSIPASQDLFNMGKKVTGLEIGLKDPYASPNIAAAMSEKYTLSIKEWLSFNRPLFEAMRTERVVIIVITGLVAAVAGFNILTTVFVSVSQRQRDISILKALGARNRQILVLFMKQSLYIGTIGATIGIALAYALCRLIERYQFIDLPDLYLLARLPMAYDPRIYAAVAAVSLAIALAAGLFPAWNASRINPVSGIRGE